jgi:hypothetical protein
VPHTIKGETVTLGKVSATTAARVAEQMPSMMVDCVSDVISDAYLTPPLQYPDGEWYFKLGSNSIHDLFFDNLPAWQHWIKNGDIAATHHAQIALLKELFAGVEWLDFASLPCVITRTPDGVPSISNVHPRVTGRSRLQWFARQKWRHYLPCRRRICRVNHIPTATITVAVGMIHPAEYP